VVLGAAVSAQLVDADLSHGVGERDGVSPALFQPRGEEHVARLQLLPVEPAAPRRARDAVPQGGSASAAARGRAARARPADPPGGAARRADPDLRRADAFQRAQHVGQDALLDRLPHREPRGRRRAARRGALR
jgi:hypothetical protein